MQITVGSAQSRSVFGIFKWKRKLDVRLDQKPSIQVTHLMCSDTICIAVPSDHLLNKVAIITGTDGGICGNASEFLCQERPGSSWTTLIRTSTTGSDSPPRFPNSECSRSLRAMVNCCFDEAKYINWVVMPTVDGITANEPIPQAQYRSSQEVDVPACK